MLSVPEYELPARSVPEIVTFALVAIVLVTFQVYVHTEEESKDRTPELVNINGMSSITLFSIE